MTRRSTAAFVALALLALLSFVALQNQLGAIWRAFAVHPEVRSELRHSLEELKLLARLQPDDAAEHRAIFERRKALLDRLEVLELSRREITRRYEIALVAMVVVIIAALAVAAWLLRRREERRLEQLRRLVGQLLRGEEPSAVSIEGNDTTARIARIVEETAEEVRRDRRRINALENLEVWQESARRVAHEIRTPLTAAKLELQRLGDTARHLSPAAAAELSGLEESVSEELDHLARFVSGFSAFASAAAPHRERLDLHAYLTQFVDLFGQQWPNLRLSVQTLSPTEDAVVYADGEMLRRVLVNLCSNASQALGERNGNMHIELDASSDPVTLRLRDDAGGVDPGLRPRLFRPYATTRREGHGLGLAISRKILLEHGGWLDLAETTASGSTFELTIPRGESA